MTTDTGALRARFDLWRERLSEASARWGGVTLCAVTKTVPPEVIDAAWDAGARLIGENRVQELMEKQPLLTHNFEVHLIGRLQTNKVKYLPGRVSMIQSLDRIELAEEISRQAEKRGLVMDALVEVNIGREAQKGGVLEEDLDTLLLGCAPLEGLRIRGLMTVMPACADPEDVRPLCKKMRRLFDERRDHPVGRARMEILSMGMSHDALVAAQEGATMVRLGSALFGERKTIQSCKLNS